MKRKHILTLVIASFFIIVAFSGANVFASISGDDACGGTKVVYDSAGKIVSGSCGINDFKKIFQGIFSLIISLGTPLLVVFVIYRFVMAWYALNQGNANAYKEATQKAGQAILGFLIVVAIMGGLFLSLLRFFGVQEPMLKLLKEITVEMVPHAYAESQADQDGCTNAKVGSVCTDAYGKSGKCSYNETISAYYCARDGAVLCPKGQMWSNNSCVADSKAVADNDAAAARLQNSTAGQINSPSSNTTTESPKSNEANNVSAPSGGSLPNPVGVTSLYDFILSALALVMRFFIYPALIAMWVWTGFSYVWAQGAPERLAKAHKLALWAFVSTLIVFVTQGFLSALRGSVQKILPKSSLEIRVEKEPLATIIKHNS